MRRRPGRSREKIRGTRATSAEALRDTRMALAAAAGAPCLKIRGSRWRSYEHSLRLTSPFPELPPRFPLLSRIFLCLFPVIFPSLSLVPLAPFLFPFFVSLSPSFVSPIPILRRPSLTCSLAVRPLHLSGCESRVAYQASVQCADKGPPFPPGAFCSRSLRCKVDEERDRKTNRQTVRDRKRDKGRKNE